MAIIEVAGLLKRFGSVAAVDGLDFALAEGTLTGFLGPNGAGKTTTLRMLLGLIHPTAGTARIHGKPYGELEQPIRHVGAVLEASSFHPGRSGREHLAVLATAASLPLSRVDAVLAEVGLSDVARRRVGGYSLGMRQRLALAAALLGEPPILLLDEPTNGLDPEGIRWMRQYLRHLADEGRTVLVSSHVLAELAQSIDHVLIINHGRLVTQAALSDLTSVMSPAVHVRTASAEPLRDELARSGIAAELKDVELVVARDTSTEAVGQAVARLGIVVYEMRLAHPDLEELFIGLTRDVEATASGGAS